MLQERNKTNEFKQETGCTVILHRTMSVLCARSSVAIGVTT